MVYAYKYNDIYHVPKALILTIMIKNHRCPPCVNGDIAIQWEWSNFDPSQNQNPLTDYDKTLHSWLRPRDERVTQNLCQSALRANTWNITPNFIFIFFLRLAYWSDFWADFHAQWLKLRAITQGSAFLESARWPTTFRGSNSPKTRHK